jgi:hypothetical protein
MPQQKVRLKISETVYGQMIQHKQTAWLNEVQFKDEIMEYQQITEEEVRNVIKKTATGRPQGQMKYRIFGGKSLLWFILL